MYDTPESTKSDYVDQGLITRLAERICPLKGSEYLRSRTKRYFDKVTASLIFTPAILTGIAATIGVALLYKVNPIYVHGRIDRDLNEFLIWKIRTLTEPESDGSQEVLGNFAQFLRHTGIDEVFQLIYVFSGKMFLTGIRAWSQKDLGRIFALEIIGLTEIYLGAYKIGGAGISGLNQLSPFRKAFAAEGEEINGIVWDLNYVFGASLALDIVILLGTVCLVVDKILELLNHEVNPPLLISS